MSGYTLDLRQCDGAARALVGGKCASLGELLRAGFAVPAGFAVTTRAYDDFVAAGRLRDLIRGRLSALVPDDLESAATIGGEIRRAVEATPIPLAVSDAIHAAYEALASSGADLVAVRSSATAEDLEGASFAGQQETDLGVRGADEVVAAVRRCWASLFTPQALVYRARMGLADIEPRMSVGVQAMVDARVAGVTFTLNPVNGDRSKIAIEVCWGLGQGLVNGDVTPDRYLVDKVTLGILTRVIAAQEIEHRFDPRRGAVVPVAVPAERRDAACLADEDVIEIARVAKRLERAQGRVLDIEWAIGAGASCADGLRLVQARPETVWSRRPARPVVPALASPLDYIHLVACGDLAARAEEA
jgi:phosphoenolpyruvate synthase/pyruvate phosphate dikinase